MTARSKKIMITCAVTGGVHTPSLSDALPYKPADMAEQAIDAAHAGALRIRFAITSRTSRASTASWRISVRA
jgi:3,5-dioxohexanoate:acetyl-CoA acetone transferase